MYSVEVDAVDKETWHKKIDSFNDGNIYQTWSYDQIRFGNKKISHMILKKNGEMVAAAQVRIVRIPFTSIGIAYVFWGPIWQRKDSEINPEVFVHAIRALKNEYAKRRGLLVRIYPVLFEDEADIYLPLLNQEGYRPVDAEQPSRTLIMDLSHSLDELRKGFNAKWRGHLSKAERNKLEIIEGSDDTFFEMFISLYKELLERKKFAVPNDINEFRLIQKELPEHYKVKIIICLYEEKPCVGAIMVTIGQTAIYLFGASNDLGMKSNGAYLIQWKFIEWLKANNFKFYNLHGINPVTNPGGYIFKSGMCGEKNGRDLFFLGKFEVCNNKLSEIAIKYGESLLAYIKKRKDAVHKTYLNYKKRNSSLKDA